MSGPITPDMDVRVLNSPGPISDAFLQSRAFVKIIIGPVGSGKTMTALRALRRVGIHQRGKRDAKGVMWRKARVGVIRETYPNIEKNTLPSWFRIHPQTDGKFTWKAPYTHRLTLILKTDEDGRAVDVCDFEVEFRAIGDRSVEEVCRGWEINAVMIDEADLQPASLIAFLSGRVGRFSELDPSLVVDPQIILALNAPYTDNWVYSFAVEKSLEALDTPELRAVIGDRPLIETFIQPGGRDPGAENLHNLIKGYYDVQAAMNAHRPDYVARMIDNKFVPMRYGQPVNPQFDYAEHVRELDWDPSRKLILSFDQGLFAAATALQRDAQGNLRTLREAVCFREGDGTLAKIGPTAFGQMCRAMLSDHFPDLHPDDLRVVGDPAAWAAEDRADKEHDWVLAFERALGAKAHRAKTNRQTIRNEAVWQAMDARGGYAADPSCKHLIRGHLGGYRYAKADMPEGETRGGLQIAKTMHSHVCEAEQYGAMEFEFIVGDIRGIPRVTGPVTNDSDFDVFSTGGF